MRPKLTEIVIDGFSKESSVISDLKKQMESSNINILLGAGFSYPVSGLLKNYEIEMAKAVESENKDDLYKVQKDFFDKVILPFKDDVKVQNGEKSRIAFISLIGGIIKNRDSALLHKIVNIFTTNYDLLIEMALEKSKLEYIDGFSGKLCPKFSTENYGRIISKQTSVSGKTSELVTFNLYKVHGSLNWRYENNEIIHNAHIATINELEKVKEDKKQFIEDYGKKLAIINPTKEKLNTTVLNNNHYDQLRMFCNELEKNNTILISFGFSFEDEHIQRMTLRALNSNPTLTLIIFSYDEKSTKKFEKIFEKFNNVNIVQAVKSENETDKNTYFSLDNVNKIFAEIYNGIK